MTRPTYDKWLILLACCAGVLIAQLPISMAHALLLCVIYAMIFTAASALGLPDEVEDDEDENMHSS